MSSTLAPMLPTAPPQTGTSDTIPSLVASSDPQQQLVLASQPPPLVTSEALVTMPVIVAAIAPIDQPERQSSGLDFDYNQFEITPRTSAPGTTAPTPP